jgi:hypothetical protein
VGAAEWSALVLKETSMSAFNPILNPYETFERDPFPASLPDDVGHCRYCGESFNFATLDDAIFDDENDVCAKVDCQRRERDRLRALLRNARI